MQRAFERLEPEGEKTVERRKARAEVVVLPDVGLQQGRMIRQAIEDLCGRQTVAV
jgi:hypothetical protein